MTHLSYAVPVFLLFLLFSVTETLSQTPAGADGYNAEAVLSRVQVLKGQPKDEGPVEMEELCQQALMHQDIKTLMVLASINPGNVQMQVLRGLPTLPAPMQKKILVVVLNDDKLWNYERNRHFTHGGFGEGQYQVQLEVRYLVGMTLGRDLVRASKYYDPDKRKQASAEAAATVHEAAIIDVDTREQLINELTAQ